LERYDIDLCLGIANQMLANHQDTPLDMERYRNAFGFPITGYYEKIGIDLKKESFEVLTEKFVQQYNEGIKSCHLFEVVKPILNQFKTKGQTQFILTAAHLDLVIPLLQQFDILHHFEQVEGVDNYHAKGKINREVQLMQDHSIQPEKTVLIGDTYHDFEVASAMNIDCILVADGHQSKERLVDFTNGEILVLNNLNELI